MSLKVWLPLNGNLHNQGYANINIENMGATINNTGKIGKCYTFNGSTTNYLRLPPILTNTDEFSIAFWVKNTATNTNYCYYSQRTEASGSGYSIFYIGGQGVRFDDGSSLQSSMTFTAGTWHHVVCCRDNTKKYIYIDGILSTSGNKTNTSASKVNSNYSLIGGSQSNAAGSSPQTNANLFNGDLNDYRIYDHCLSAAEAREISQGLVLHYKLDGFLGGINENLVLNSNALQGTQFWNNWGTATNRSIVEINGKKWFHHTSDSTGTKYGGFSQNSYGNGVDIPWTPNTQYTISALVFASADTPCRFWFHMRSSEGGANISQPLKNFTATTIPQIYTYTFNSGTNASYTINRFCIMIGSINSTQANDVYVTNIKIEKGSQATSWCLHTSELGIDITKIEDSSGYNHNGTITGNIQITSDSSRYSNCIYIPSGNTDYITTNDEIGNFSEGITTSIWFKSSNQTPGNNYHELFNIATATQNFEHAIYKTGYFRGGMVINGTRYVANTDNTNLTDGNWHHIAMTYNGAILRRYVDGIDKSDTTISGTLTSTSCKFLFGHYGTNTSYYAKETYLSDARIYCTALDADAIRQLYEVGAKVDNKGNLHTFELNETNTNLLSGIPWCAPFSSHTPLTSPFINYNSNGEPQFTSNSTSAGSDYIEISPTGHTYEYDYTISVNAGNQFYIGFERYDANKTARSNNACVYTFASKPSSNIVKQHYTGTINLATDGTNPCKYIALRILNGWSGTTSGVTGTATIHSISLRQIGTKQQPKITKTGLCIGEELKEETNTKLHKNGIIETNNLIEL